MAQKEFEETCKYLDAQANYEIYECVKYDVNSDKIKENYGYYGETIIEDIEKDFGKIIKDLGLHKNISSAIIFYENEIEEER